MWRSAQGKDLWEHKESRGRVGTRMKKVTMSMRNVEAVGEESAVTVRVLQDHENEISDNGKVSMKFNQDVPIEV